MDRNFHKRVSRVDQNILAALQGRSNLEISPDTLLEIRFWDCLLSSFY